MPVEVRPLKRAKKIKTVTKMIDDSISAVEMGLDQLIPIGPEADPFTHPVDLAGKTIGFEKRYQVRMTLHCALLYKGRYIKLEFYVFMLIYGLAIKCSWL